MDVLPARVVVPCRSLWPRVAPRGFAWPRLSLCGPAVAPPRSRCGPSVAGFYVPVVAPLWLRCGPAVAPLWPVCGPVVAPLWPR